MWTLRDTHGPNLGKCRRFKHHVLPSFRVSALFLEFTSVQATGEGCKVPDPTGSLHFVKMKTHNLGSKVWLYNVRCADGSIKDKQRSVISSVTSDKHILHLKSTSHIWISLFLKACFQIKHQIRIDLIKSSGIPVLFICQRRKWKISRKMMSISKGQTKEADGNVQRFQSPWRPWINSLLNSVGPWKNMHIGDYLNQVSSHFPITWGEKYVQTSRWTIQQLKQQQTFMMTYGYPLDEVCHLCLFQVGKNCHDRYKSAA